MKAASGCLQYPGLFGSNSDRRLRLIKAVRPLLTELQQIVRNQTRHNLGLKRIFGFFERVALRALRNELLQPHKRGWIDGVHQRHLARRGHHHLCEMIGGVNQLSIGNLNRPQVILFVAHSQGAKVAFLCGAANDIDLETLAIGSRLPLIADDRKTRVGFLLNLNQRTF